jgi:hypothetical protein
VSRGKNLNRYYTACEIFIITLEGLWGEIVMLICGSATLKEISISSFV